MRSCAVRVKRNQSFPALSRRSSPVGLRTHMSGHGGLIRTGFLLRRLCLTQLNCTNSVRLQFSSFLSSQQSRHERRFGGKTCVLQHHATVVRSDAVERWKLVESGAAFRWHDSPRITTRGLIAHVIRKLDFLSICRQGLHSQPTFTQIDAENIYSSLGLNQIFHFSEPDSK